MFLVAFLVFTLVVVSGIPFCNVTDASLLECFQALLDPQSTGNVSQTDLASRLTNLNQTFGITAPGIMNNCDADHDGYLTVDDWYSPNRTCLRDYNSRLIACFSCNANGYTRVLQKQEN
jgi:hypothetical protein